MVYFFMTLLVFIVSINTMVSIQSLERKIMSIEQKSGYFFAIDKKERRVILEWHIADITSSKLAEFKKEVSEFASEMTAVTEVEFLKAYPQAVSDGGGFLKSCEQFFSQGVENVDWRKIEEVLKTSIKYFYLMSISQFDSQVIDTLKDDIYFFVSLKDEKNGNLLGFMMASITPNLPKGTMKLINLLVQQNEEQSNETELLLSCIIKIFPDVERIFTLIRPTNHGAKEMFEACGFEFESNPIQDPNHPINTEYLLVLEYKLSRSTALQRAAYNLMS